MNFTAYRAILSKELRSVWRERTIAIALLIQLFIASFSSAILMGLMTIYDPASLNLGSYVRIRVGYVEELDPALEAALLENNVALSAYASAEEGEAAYNSNQIDVLFVPPASDQAAAEGEAMQIYMPASDARASVFQLILQDPLTQYEDGKRQANDIFLRYQDLEGVSSFTFEFRYGVLVPLLMFFPAFVCGGMVVDTISEELMNHTLETLWSGPMSLNTILLAKCTSAVLIASGQVVLWTGLLQLNGIVMSNLGWTWALAVISAGLVAVTSTLIALTFKDRERSQFIYALLILGVVSVGFMFDFSPVVLMTRFTAGDPLIGILEVGVYALLLGGLWFILTRISKRLVASG